MNEKRKTTRNELSATHGEKLDKIEEGSFRSDLVGPCLEITFQPIKGNPKVIVVGAAVSPGEIPVALRAPSISPGLLQSKPLTERKNRYKITTHNNPIPLGNSELVTYSLPNPHRLSS